MQYVLLNNNVVSEVIPEINPKFPDIPISERYTVDFIAKLKPISDEIEVGQNYVYDSESETFIAPEKYEPVETTMKIADLMAVYQEGVESIG